MNSSIVENLRGEWVCTEGRLCLLIASPPDGETEVTIWSGLGERLLAGPCPARYHPRTPNADADPDASRRLDRLVVELGDVNLGPTYTLLIAGPNTDPGAWGGFAARPVLPSDTPDLVTLFPEAGASYYEAVLGYYDDVAEAEREAFSWRHPLGRFRRATVAEALRLRGGVP